MSYTPTTWAAGDVVTAAKLNKLEQGVANAGGGGLLIVHSSETGSGFVLDKTAGEIWSSGYAVLEQDTNDEYGYGYRTVFSGMSHFSEGYEFWDREGHTYTATSANEYPYFEDIS